MGKRKRQDTSESTVQPRKHKVRRSSNPSLKDTAADFRQSEDASKGFKGADVGTSMPSAVEQAIRALKPPQGLSKAERKAWRKLARTAALAVPPEPVWTAEVLNQPARTIASQPPLSEQNGKDIPLEPPTDLSRTQRKRRRRSTRKAGIDKLLKPPEGLSKSQRKRWRKQTKRATQEDAGTETQKWQDTVDDGQGPALPSATATAISRDDVKHFSTTMLAPVLKREWHVESEHEEPPRTPSMVSTVHPSELEEELANESANRDEAKHEGKVMHRVLIDHHDSQWTPAQDRHLNYSMGDTLAQYRGKPLIPQGGQLKICHDVISRRPSAGRRAEMIDETSGNGDTVADTAASFKRFTAFLNGRNGDDSDEDSDSESESESEIGRSVGGGMSRPVGSTNTAQRSLQARSGSEGEEASLKPDERESVHTRSDAADLAQAALASTSGGERTEVSDVNSSSSVITTHSTDEEGSSDDHLVFEVSGPVREVYSAPGMNSPLLYPSTGSTWNPYSANVGRKRQFSPAIPPQAEVSICDDPAVWKRIEAQCDKSHLLYIPSLSEKEEDDAEVMRSVDEITRDVFADTRPLPAGKPSLPLPSPPAYPTGREAMALDPGLTKIASSGPHVTPSTPKANVHGKKRSGLAGPGEILRVPQQHRDITAYSARVPDMEISVPDRVETRSTISQAKPDARPAAEMADSLPTLKMEESGSSLSELGQTPSPPPSVDLFLTKNGVPSPVAADAVDFKEEPVLPDSEKEEATMKKKDKKKRKMTGTSSKHFTPEKRRRSKRVAAKVAEEEIASIQNFEDALSDSSNTAPEDKLDTQSEISPLSPSPIPTPPPPTKRNRKGTGKKSTYFTPTPSKPRLDPDIIDRVDFHNTTAGGKKTRTPAGVSTAPVPPISDANFGIIQEKLWREPFWLLIAVTFLNKTTGRAAAPVFWDLKKRYRSAEGLAGADVKEVEGLVWNLGLQRQRARRLIKIAGAWVARPPVRGRGGRTVHYPLRGDGKRFKKGQTLFTGEVGGAGESEVEPEVEGEGKRKRKRKRKGKGKGQTGTDATATQAPSANIGYNDDICEGWLEIGHIPGLGPYAWDSWRIFCRDVLRGVAKDYNGLNAKSGPTPALTPTPVSPANPEEGTSHSDPAAPSAAEKDVETPFEPEWKRVLPLDKELRACLKWMWLREGFVWDFITGEKRLATEEEMEAARRGEVEVITEIAGEGKGDRKGKDGAGPVRKSEDDEGKEEGTHTSESAAEREGDKGLGGSAGDDVLLSPARRRSRR